MREVFEPVPLIAAGLIGGLVLLIIDYVGSENESESAWTVAGAGVATGVLVQIGVRAIGVS